MSNQAKKWEILSDSTVVDQKSLFSILLKNRGIESNKQKEEFLNPTDPAKISLTDLGIKSEAIKNTINRIKKAKKNNEFVIIYGDYDADGITASAILWEALHETGINVLPFIPDRFEDGYGIKPEAVEKLKNKFPELSLIVTVDNGIVAYDGIAKAKELGIDTIVIDHHQKGSQKLNTLYVIHNTNVCGSALAWFFAKDLVGNTQSLISGLELAAIGTIADQMPLIGVNRSIVKYGLSNLAKTKRPGLLALFKESGLKGMSSTKPISTYEVGYIIAPRLNAMGRLKNGLESLRLLCTKDIIRAGRIAGEIGKVNAERQKIVEEVVAHALNVSKGKIPNVIVLASEKYHEGVIGLAAARLVEKLYRPAIVISKKGDIAKASARSIAGFNIIEAIRKLNKYYIEGGGHPMAAGFSIKTQKIEIFAKKINSLAKEILTDEILQRKLKVDCEISFDLLSLELLHEISSFEPTGIGSPEPVFLSRNVDILSVRPVGKESKHLKLKVKQDEHIIDSIFFGGGEMYSKLNPDRKVDLVYSLERNVWNWTESLQLKIKDIAIKPN